MIVKAKQIVWFLTAMVVVAGCQKKASVSSAPPPQATNTAEAESAATPPPAPVAAPVAVPVAAPPVDISNVKQSLAESDAEIKSKSYAKAALTILALQRQAAMNPEQAQEAANQMRTLQAGLAQAVANGEPGAKEAVQILQNAAMR